MKLSIAMTTYNGEKYLKEQLQSFINQTRQPDELVVCDDCSSDLTLEILEEFSKQSSYPVIIHRNERNIGYIKNFDKVLTLCSGDIVFLSDQDDVWFPEKIEIIEKCFIFNPEVMVILNDQVISDSNLISTSKTTIGNIRSLGFDESWHSAGCCSAIRKEFINIVCDIPDEAHGHDGWINSLAVALNVREIVDKPLQYYRRHGENTSESIANKSGNISLFDILKIYFTRNVNSGWTRKIKLLKLYRKRLFDKSLALEALNLCDSRDAAIKDLTEKINVLDIRVQIATMSRLKRLPLVLKLFNEGGYSYFSGWKSAMKDIVR